MTDTWDGEKIIQRRNRRVGHLRRSKMHWMFDEALGVQGHIWQLAWRHHGYERHVLPRLCLTVTPVMGRKASGTFDMFVRGLVF